MLNVAFKEWAVICRALGDGLQSVIIRKGGIAEAAGEFRPEHERFLLLPTYYHERQRTGINPELLPLLDAVETSRPAAGSLQFTHFAEVAKAIHLAELEQALALETLHGWTAETIRQRFEYRAPGLHVLPVRVYELAKPVNVLDMPEYAGCKTWVHLAEGVEAEGARPVLTDESFHEVLKKLTALTLRGVA